MSTYREIVSMILDEVKLVHDDSHFNDEHVLFIIDKLRVFLLKQRYSDLRKEIPDSNYQTICVSLENANSNNPLECNFPVMKRSTVEIPFMMSVGSRRVTPINFFSGDFNYVSSERFRYVAGDKYTSKQIYSTIAPDKKLYLKSLNSQLQYLERVKVTGLFEDTVGASMLSCDTEGPCDIFDMRFPMEESLITPLIELAVKEISMAKYQAEDNINNASDDLSNIASYIRQQLAEGRRSDLYKNP